MPSYRRCWVPGGSFFFTMVTERRAPLLCTDLARQILGQAFRATRQRWPFRIDAIVLLPDHLHTMWTLPHDDADYAKRWGFLKKEFTKVWLEAGGEEQVVSPIRRRHRRHGVLQRKYWEHYLRDELDYERHVEYCHYNPVKHGLIGCPHLWPYSTFHRDVRRGLFSVDWACGCNGRKPSLPSFRRLAATAME
jgi:putative transposase